MIPDVKSIADKCTKKMLEEEINDWPTCLQDISKIVELAGKITQDIKQFNFV